MPKLSLTGVPLKNNNNEEEGDAVLKRSSRLYFDDLNDHNSVSDESDKDRTIDLNGFKFFQEKKKEMASQPQKYKKE